MPTILPHAGRGRPRALPPDRVPLSTIWLALDIDRSGFYRRYLPADDEERTANYSRQLGLTPGSERPRTADRELAAQFVARESGQLVRDDLPASQRARGTHRVRAEELPTPIPMPDAPRTQATPEGQFELWSVAS